MPRQQNSRDPHFRTLLEQEKKELLSHISRENFSLRDSTGELSTVDNHPADQGSELFERSKDLALHDRQEKKLGDIENALRRLDQGIFGYCLACGRPIPEERLQAVPHAAYCLSCQNLREKESRENEQDDRPIEEQLLRTPFSRTFACQRGNENCAGEDAWQDVSAYGNSESLQDHPEENPPGRRPGR